MYYIKNFKTQEEYEAYKASPEWITPNLCSIAANNLALFQEYDSFKLCDIAYFSYNDEKIKTIKATEWNVDLGEPIGIVVIPENFLPDGKARIVALNRASANGNYTFPWLADTSTDTSSLASYMGIPMTDNKTNTITGLNTTAYYPSDKFKGESGCIVSDVDPEAYYNTTTTNIMTSPYFNGKLNPSFVEMVSPNNNALSDFNGKINTSALYNLESPAAAVANSYSSAGNLNWYLPSLGELVFVGVRWAAIDSVRSILGVDNMAQGAYWTSTNSLTMPYGLGLTTRNSVSLSPPNTNLFILPFAILENPHSYK